MLTDDEKRQQLALFGEVVGNIWRVEARFSHINGPVVYSAMGDFIDESAMYGKEDAYRQVGKWLMSENIQRILVYRNGELQQTITVA